MKEGELIGTLVAATILFFFWMVPRANWLWKTLKGRSLRWREVIFLGVNLKIALIVAYVLTRYHVGPGWPVGIIGAGFCINLALSGKLQSENPAPSSPSASRRFV